MSLAYVSQPPLGTAAEQASLAFVEALNVGDLELAGACMARDACLITPDATAIHGRAEIRTLLVQMVARGSQIEVTHSTILCAGEVALARQRWLVRSEGVEGQRYKQILTPTLVLRCLGDDWKLAIVMPWDRRSEPYDSTPRPVSSKSDGPVQVLSGL